MSMIRAYFYSSQKYTRLQYKKIKFKRLEPYCLPIFKLQQRGATGSRAWKLLPLCHRHGSAPRSPYLPCQILDQWKSFELEQKNKVSVTKKTEVEVLPGIYLIVQLAKMSFFRGQCNTGER